MFITIKLQITPYTRMLISPQPDHEGNKLQPPNYNFCKPLKKNNSEGCPSNQVSAAAVTSASDEKWLAFNCLFQSGQAKDLSAPLQYKQSNVFLKLFPHIFRPIQTLLFYWIYVTLEEFIKLRKATVTFVMSVRPSSWNNSAPIGAIFMKIDI